MILSLNEIESGIRKAALGAGLPLGFAEDTGRAVAFLHAAGFDGISAALPCFRVDFTPAVVMRNGALVRFEGGHPISRAIAALDLVAAGQAQQAELFSFEQPLLLAGLAMVCSSEQGVGFSLTFATAAKASIFAQNIVIDGEFPNGPAAVLILQSNRQTGVPLSQPQMRNVDKYLWDQVTRLAARTYVPSSAQSRLLGAGAGVTDND